MVLGGENPIFQKGLGATECGVSAGDVDLFADSVGAAGNPAMGEG